MISLKMLTFALLVLISNRKVAVDAIPLLEEGKYILIPIGGGQTFYDNDVPDLTVCQV